MNREIKPFKYNGSIYINSSKSIYQRAVAIACLSKKKFQIIGDSNNTDSQTAIRICKEMGFNIVKSDNNLEIFESLEPVKNRIIASVQNNFAFHDVNPVKFIKVSRRALYFSISCSQAIWKPDEKWIMKLTKSRYNYSVLDKILMKIKKFID